MLLIKHACDVMLNSRCHKEKFKGTNEQIIEKKDPNICKT